MVGVDADPRGEPVHRGEWELISAAPGSKLDYRLLMRAEDLFSGGSALLPAG